MASSWDNLYAEEGYAFGKEPNGYLAAMTPMLKHGKTLCLGAGEGRNAVYLASLGFDVLAVDASAIGLAKAERLASEVGVKIETHLEDLATFDMGDEQFENIVSVFCHVPSTLRRRLHSAAVRALRPGGMFLLEAFRSLQLGMASFGPTELDLLMDRGPVELELAGLEMIRVGEVIRLLDEGRCYSGRGAVLELIARKPHVHRPLGAVH